MLPGKLFVTVKADDFVESAVSSTYQAWIPDNGEQIEKNEHESQMRLNTIIMFSPLILSKNFKCK